MPILLNGRALALNLRAELKNKVTQLTITPRLGVILVGDDPASHLYVSLKERAAREVGIAVEKILMPKNSTTEQVIEQVQKFNQRPNIHGILVQLPLPDQINEHEVIAAMDPTKDADGFHPQNLKKLTRNKPAIIPGVSSGIVKLIELSGQALKDKRACLIVNSDEFAKPLTKLLENAGVKVDVKHSAEPAELGEADIIVVAIGQPGVIKGEFVKDGSIIIDVGTTKVGEKVMGDVDATSLSGRHVYLTPVPGGVGPMTVAMLLWNMYTLAKRLA